ncbi:MAG: ABC transporter ATP-binding protein [Candidatus Zixiibacteriota bacterium]
MRDKKILVVEDLRVYYDAPTGVVKAVDGVNLNLDENEILGIAGESACGKSTFAYGLIRLCEYPRYIAGGRIFFEDMNLLEIREEEMRKVRREKITLIPQAAMNALNPVLRIESQFDDVLDPLNIPKDEAKQLVSTSLKNLGLSPDIVKKYPHELSGGMKQRVVISMATILNPKILIADEPTSALDVVSQREIIQLIMDLVKGIKSSMILITHDMAIHAECVDKIAVMYAGQIVETGDVKGIFEEPRHPYAKILISSVPSLRRKEIPKGTLGKPPDMVNPPSGCRFHPRCSYASEICAQKEPELIEMEDGRKVACHLYQN